MSEDSSSKLIKKRPGLGSPLGVVFNVLAVFLLGQVIAGVLVQLAGQLLSPGFRQIDSSTIAEFFFVLLAEGSAALFVFYVLRRRKLDLSVVGLGRLPNWRDLTKAVGGFVVFYVVLIVLASLASVLWPDLNKGNQDIGFNNLTSPLDTFLAFFALVILPPLGEETLIRGYLYSGLRRKLKLLPAMVITSLIFGAAHLFSGDGGLLWSAGLNTFILSVVLVYLRESSGALYAGMLVHMLNNLVAFSVHFK